MTNYLEAFKALSVAKVSKVAQDVREKGPRRKRRPFQDMGSSGVDLAPGYIQSILETASFMCAGNASIAMTEGQC